MRPPTITNATITSRMMAQKAQRLQMHNYKCNDYHQNDGAKRRNDYKCATISTVAGYLPAMRKICVTTLADRANNKMADIKSARKENHEGADPA